MQIYRVEATVSSDGTLTLKKIPFQAGDRVEVILRGCQPARRGDGCYPLRGTPIRYADPFASVAEDDWEALQ
jgi:hypothetical protein